MSVIRKILARLTRPFSSRKIRIAAATVAVSMAAEFGINVGQETMLTILGIGVALILGVAHEDAGKLSRPSTERKNAA